MKVRVTGHNFSGCAVLCLPPEEAAIQFAHDFPVPWMIHENVSRVVVTVVPIDEEAKACNWQSSCGLLYRNFEVIKRNGS